MNRLPTAAITATFLATLVTGGLAVTPAGQGRPVHGTRQAAQPAPPPARGGHPALPRPRFGVTTDSITNLNAIMASSRHLPDKPTTRIYFDVSHGPRYYLRAATRLHRVSYLMGELLDSADEAKITVSGYNRRVKAYLATLGRRIDIWEIGNEVNGDWTGPYPAVAAKLTEAYRAVSARGYATALTLYYDIGCHDGCHELHPLAFSRRYVPRAVRDGLRYVLLSYYQDDCRKIRPTSATWTSFFRKLHALYPSALVGFGEIGLNDPVTRRTRPTAGSLIRYYYGLRIRLPYYIGGYFWWYYREDCLPYTTKPLWRVLATGFKNEAAAIRHTRPRWGRGGRAPAGAGPRSCVRWSGPASCVHQPQDERSEDQLHGQFHLPAWDDDDVGP